ncbi:MAG: RNA polymerase sigma-70 factor (ECF subfamily) [Crocinitomicaceae bacterium]
MGDKKNIKQLSESEVIALAKKDQTYFGALYDNYFEQIFRFIFKRLGGNEAVSGDLTQQTFMKAMANLEKYEDRGLPFSSWLYRIAQNEVSMHFRKQKKAFTVPIDENRVMDVATEASLDTQYMTSDQQEKLISKLNNLDAAQLDLIELRFFQELSFKQIAEIYKITEANAKMRTYRILERINKTWKND